MKKLVKEVGVSALLSIASSGSISMETLRLLTSTAYDRSMEKEADSLGVEYLIESGINPEPLADMLFRLSLDESPLLKNLAFVSSHPDTDDRVRSILKQASKQEREYEALVPDFDWEDFQKLANE